jgi:hypothetical protein
METVHGRPLFFGEFLIAAVTMKRLFREHRLRLQAQSPVRALLRLLAVVERLRLEVSRQFADAHDLAHAAVQRYGPAERRSG